MIRQRRRALEKLHTRGAPSVTERILGFVQGAVVVESLCRASDLRTQRAYGRARCFEWLSTVLDCVEKEVDNDLALVTHTTLAHVNHATAAFSVTLVAQVTPLPGRISYTLPPCLISYPFFCVGYGNGIGKKQNGL